MKELVLCLFCHSEHFIGNERDCVDFCECGEPLRAEPMDREDYITELAESDTWYSQETGEPMTVGDFT